MNIDETFPHAYEFKALAELPSRPVERFYYPGASKHGGRDGLLIEVNPHKGSEWTGVFAFGTVSPNGVNGLYTCPDEATLCVVSKGDGYLVNVERPLEHEVICLMPILGVVPCHQSALLVFHDFTRFVAYGRTGLAWKTPSLSWDGLKVLEVHGASLRGQAWDAASERHIEFELDLETGMHRGGSSPELR